MTNIKFRIFIFLSFIMISCNKDWFTPIVDLNIPAHESKLVVYANWQVGSDSLWIFVSSSRAALDSTPYMVDSLIARQGGRGGQNFIPFNYDTVPNTVVEIFRNDILWAKALKAGPGFYALLGKNKIDTTGNVVYKVMVSAPNYQTVEAIQPTYQAPKLINLSYKANAAFYTDPNDFLSTPQRGDEIGIEFLDNTTENNYYDVLSAYFEYNDASGVLQQSRTFIPRSIDPLSENEVLPDVNFNGKNYKWLLWARNRDYNFGGRGGGPGVPNGNTNYIPKSGDKLTMTVRTFNKDWYLFKKSRALLNQAQNNIFFSEPVLLYSNVNKGYGIFFINAERKITVTLP